MKSLMVIDARKCTECNDCISACKKEHGESRAIKTHSVPMFCMHCHPDKAPCRQVCPVDAIEEMEGVLIVNEDACILCRLCMIACPIGALVINNESKSVEKCTLCMETDKMLPACVEACKYNVLKLFSAEDLEELRRENSNMSIILESLKRYKDKDIRKINDNNDK
ncbi:4Fe-4S ferredoxin iron-sulfur binding domain protein [Methanococcus vannielii SB]|jgi:Fe-S-cluster-containing hydrogenase component 2|uniref:4Fe-4S ferredoxin iron-sulfur binding domain protein n=1 Tax=Methanococcus vannielii (strain ATCC 35089 / DSM 1224 / JCM 13029 / OCM 148 / SB) TaxID=406327 RepID=A6UNZ2_METVS|nr:4Fe-4S dicluster domain-containing protein [Methanococcus vannielii]ABR54214.1 4Fe-4S ferredoxin iron-sulfur binding domain protein [Methanococcus vannielii SB]